MLARGVQAMHHRTVSPYESKMYHVIPTALPVVGGSQFLAEICLSQEGSCPTETAQCRWAAPLTMPTRWGPQVAEFYGLFMVDRI